MSGSNKRRIWIDLDNSPHVPFFKPIIDRLTERGYSVLVTARDCFQVCGLADLLNLQYKRVGRHYGKNVILKFYGLLYRSLQLAPMVFDYKPDLAVAHGSRSQLVVSKLLGVPSIMIDDYEHSRNMLKPTWIMTPEVIPEESMHSVRRGFIKYHGIKEDVYVPTFTPDPAIMDDLKLNKDRIVVTIRPPATEAHYHNPESDVLFAAIINHLGQMKNIQQVILPRNKKQESSIKQTWTRLFDRGIIIIPDHVIDGLNLIWHSDLVISGGGTMNREAAALGVPVYSFFRGKIGAVDQYLVKNNRLVLLSSVDDILTKLKIEKRDVESGNSPVNNGACASIVQSIIQILEH
ncbi:MAG: DUF354 domain-containing protein [Syntrophobacteraceae bacterium]|jgi:predicted glycosyltransferase